MVDRTEKLTKEQVAELIADMIDAKGFFDRVCQALGTTSLTQIGNKVGLTKHSATQWKKGGFASVETIAAIAKLGGVSMHWLISGKEAPNEIKLDPMDAGNVAFLYANSNLPAEFVQKNLQRVGGDLTKFGKLLAKLILLGEPTEGFKETLLASDRATADSQRQSRGAEPKREELTQPSSKKKRKQAR